MSTTEHIFCVHQIFGAGGGRYNDAINKLFIDFMQSYDSIRREFSCNTLIECGITMKEVQSIIMCLKEPIVQSGKANICMPSFLLRKVLDKEMYCNCFSTWHEEGKEN